MQCVTVICRNIQKTFCKREKMLVEYILPCGRKCCNCPPMKGIFQCNNTIAMIPFDFLAILPCNFYCPFICFSTERYAVIVSPEKQQPESIYHCKILTNLYRFRCQNLYIFFPQNLLPALHSRFLPPQENDDRWCNIFLVFLKNIILFHNNHQSFQTHA